MSASDMQGRERVIVRTSVIGIVANVMLAAFKAVIGILSNSIAVTLDAVNNLTDALSSIVTILGAKLGGRKPDRKHPLGHGRYEYLSAIIIAAIVLYAGITSLVESVKKIITPEMPDYSITALVIIAVAVVVKLFLGRYTSAKGHQVDSGSLVASGKDALFDAALSLSVLAAAVIYLATGVSLEAYVGAVISVVIVKAGIDILRESVDDILGHRPDPELSAGIKRTVCADPDVLGAYDLLLHSYGPNLIVGSVHVEVPDMMTASQIDAMTRRIQEAVASEHHIALATVGIYSRNTVETRAVEMRSEVTRRVMAHDGVIQMHGFFSDLDAQRISFDIVVDFAVEDREALCKEIAEEIRALYPDFEVAVTLDLDLSD